MRIVLFTLLITISSIPALAQEIELQPGIQHKKIYNSPRIVNPKPPEVEKPIRPTLQSRKTEAQAQKTSTTEETTPTQRIWNKYKELATGTAPQNTTEATPPAVPAPTVETEKTADASAQQEKPQSGLASLLQQYQQNKDNQRQMQSKSFPTPKLNN